ncbi:MAG: DUF86 domain-containing protein [Prevotella sp.]|nr:DUF86 domain-containing protein [Prevotella sp.]
MRERIKDVTRLYHIRKSIDNVLEFMDGKTYDSLMTDKLLFYGVVKNIEIIGEASNMLTKEFRDRHAEQPWQDIIDMRHVLVHGYYTVSPRFIWDTYTNDLLPLRESIARYIAEIEQQE